MAAMLSLWMLSGSYLMPVDSTLACLGLVSRRPGRVLPQKPTSHDKQISPDKDMNCRSTTAPFTVSAEPRASLSCANLPTDSAFYDVLVHRLTALLQASFRQSLATLPLPFASSCCIFKIQEFTYRGLAPHEFMPMPGVHINWS